MKQPITRFVRFCKNRKVKGRFYKFMFLIVELHGLTLVTISYWLAWNEKINVLEGLSSTVITEVVAPFIVYSISRLTENLAEHNKTKFHEPISSEKAEG